MKQDELNKRAYGLILKNSRTALNLTQEQLAQECHTCRETIIAIENAKTPPNRTFRELFAKTLSNPMLEYFPPYSVGQFRERVKVRFQHEKEAAIYFLKELQPKDLNSFKEVYFLYKLAFEQKDTTLMVVLDEYLHTRIMNAHPESSIRSLVERYRQDYMDFFKIWISKLNLEIALRSTNHFEIFEAILEQNQHRLIEAIDLHLENCLEDIERLKTLLMNDNN
jgi:transcriptional regulator with XRE-family HTH domain